MTLKRSLAGVILMFAHAGVCTLLDRREGMWNISHAFNNTTAAHSVTVVESSIQLQG